MQHPYPDDSMYRGGRPFTRAQLTFFVESTLAAAVDMIDGGLPVNITLDDRKQPGHGIEADPCKLSWYERGALETAGMAISIMYAQLTGDGMGAGDALAVADNFDKAIENMVRLCWEDGGEKVKAAFKTAGEGTSYSELIPGYPNVSHHTKVFMDAILGQITERLPKATG